MSDNAIGSAITAKLGPLPVWIWGIALGGTISVGRALLARRSASTGATPDETATGDTIAATAVPVPAVGAAGYELGNANPGGWNPPADPVAGSLVTAPTTNSEWLSRAVERIVATGNGYSPIVVTDALRKYLAQSPTTAQEQAIASLALRELGVPPEGAPQLVNAPTPTGTSPTTPTTPRPVTVPTPSIRKGQRGAAVVELQVELTTLGLDPGPVDGIYGDRTQAAVLRLQRMLGMTGTSGVEYGPILADKLRAYKLARAAA